MVCEQNEHKPDRSVSGNKFEIISCLKTHPSAIANKSLKKISRYSLYSERIECADVEALGDFGCFFVFFREHYEILNDCG